jgi:AcrR family transcriptional regulator
MRLHPWAQDKPIRKVPDKALQRKRGRPRKYDARVAIWRALEIFWERGYADTSLADLSTATGMSGPNTNAVFGDKRAIYLVALEHFREEMRDMISTFVESDRPVGDALLDLFRCATELYRRTSVRPGGCPIVCAAPAEAAREPEIRSLLRGILLDVDQQIAVGTSRLEGIKLSRSSDAANRGRLAAAIIHSLAIRACTSESPELLEEFARFSSRLVTVPLH